VRDTTAPALSCPVDVTQEASDSTGASVSYPAATVKDAVTAAPEVTYSHVSGSTFPMGDTAITVTARDAADNTATCSFDVRVKDGTAPNLMCPGPATVEAQGPEGTPVSYSAEASDAVSTVTLTYSTQPGTVFASGTTTVTVTAKDAADNASTCSFPVTVRDTTAPVVTCPANVQVETREASGLVVEFPAATATDAVTTAPQVTYSQASGSTFPSGTTSVTTTATDEAGNAATCSFQVTVTAVQEPEPTAPGPIQVPVPAGCGCGATGSAGAGLGWMMLLLSWGAVRRPARSRR
jgi:flavin reductase (DIM6/NTAB) family NADH-FMN oxidoreductase RutF